MGFNYGKVGWGSVTAFVQDMFRGEAQQLQAFLGYVRSAHLAGAIARHDWARFARGYNGAGYAASRYDQHLAQAYAAIQARRHRMRAIP